MTNIQKMSKILDPPLIENTYSTLCVVLIYACFIQYLACCLQGKHLNTNKINKTIIEFGSCI